MLGNFAYAMARMLGRVQGGRINPGSRNVPSFPRAFSGNPVSFRASNLPEALQQLRRGLLREPGGDRLMAQALAIIPTAGLEAVLVAVELTLENAPSLGG
jgi:hypothetical protein